MCGTAARNRKRLNFPNRYDSLIQMKFSGMIEQRNMIPYGMSPAI
jgi:hypothetical protein